MLTEKNKLKKDPIDTEPIREYISYEEDMRKIQNTLLRKAKEEGIEQGINSSKIEIAKNLLKNNIDITIICESTGLTKEEIEKINIA